MKKIGLCIIALCLLASCGRNQAKIRCTEPSSVRDQGYFLLTDCKAVYWQPSSIPLPIYLDSTVDSRFVDAITAAARVWENAVARQLFVFTRQQSQNGIYFVDAGSWSYEKDQSATTAFIPDESNHSIKYANIYFNKKYRFSETGDPGAIDVMSVALHELGHVLGLTHLDPSEDPASVMNPHLGPGELRRFLSSGDIARIRSHY